MGRPMAVNSPIDYGDYTSVFKAVRQRRAGHYQTGRDPDYDTWYAEVARLLFETETASKLISSVNIPDA